MFRVWRKDRARDDLDRYVADMCDVTLCVSLYLCTFVSQPVLLMLAFVCASSLHFTLYLDLT